MPKRRRFSPEYKARLVLELISGQRSAAEIARKEHIKDTMLSEWRAQFLEHAPEVFNSPQANRESEQLSATCCTKPDSIQPKARVVPFAHLNAEALSRLGGGTHHAPRRVLLLAHERAAAVGCEAHAGEACPEPVERMVREQEVERADP